MATRISYEVYALTDGRWQLHASFPISGRDASLETAKQLDSEGFVDSVAVVRETFDPRRNRFDELVVYQAGRVKAPPPTSGLPPIDTPKVPQRRPDGGVHAAVGMARAADAQTPLAPPLDRSLTRMVDDAHRLLGLDIDAHTRFGLALFLAGMADVLGRAWQMQSVEVDGELARQYVRLGFSEDSARALVDNADDYLLRNRYFAIFEAGRARTQEALEGRRGRGGLVEALALWAAPSTDAPPMMRTPDGMEPLTAVLVSDIADAPRLRAIHGPAWQSRILRTHDEVLREALDHFGGREIRHLGQGILSAFIHVEHALDAALATLKGIRRFDELMPDHAFDLRLAIAAAQPIHDRGAVFDSPVRLARRLLIKAEAGDIVVNAKAARIAAPRGAGLEWMRVVPLKGFAEDQPIFKVIRQDGERRGPPATAKSMPDAAPKRPPVWEARRP